MTEERRLRVREELLRVVRLAATCARGPHCMPELEVRLGRTNPYGTQFNSGVDRTTFEAISKMLYAAEGLSAPHAYVMQTYGYLDASGRAMRTRVGSVPGQVANTRKRRVAYVDLRVDLVRHGWDRRRPPDLRVCTSTEEAVPRDQVPAIVPQADTHSVRLTHRTSWTYRCPTSGRDTIRYDLSQVWSGRDREEADRAEQQDQATYEVEIEVVDPVAYLGASGEAHVAADLIVKALDLLREPEGGHGGLRDPANMDIRVCA